MPRVNPVPISRDDVECLSRGRATKSRSGNVRVGHRLTKRERELFERAKRSGYLSLPYAPMRENVMNIYIKWCEATGISPDVRRKNSVHSDS